MRKRNETSAEETVRVTVASQTRECSREAQEKEGKGRNLTDARLTTINDQRSDADDKQSKIDMERRGRKKDSKVGCLNRDNLEAGFSTAKLLTVRWGYRSGIWTFAAHLRVARELHFTKPDRSFNYRVCTNTKLVLLFYATPWPPRAVTHDMVPSKQHWNVQSRDRSKSVTDPRPCVGGSSPTAIAGSGSPSLKPFPQRLQTKPKKTRKFPSGNERTASYSRIRLSQFPYLLPYERPVANPERSRVASPSPQDIIYDGLVAVECASAAISYLGNQDVVDGRRCQAWNGTFGQDDEISDSEAIPDKCMVECSCLGQAFVLWTSTKSTLISTAGAAPPEED
ncbi:hypothetical protein CPC08DRAFT_729376 [Agrocybe pediades]|nr:hypothetical protein CPC08DRAFT_729376 [Agrocybe pediades]